MAKLCETDFEEDDSVYSTVGATFWMIVSNRSARSGEKRPTIEQNSLSLANASTNWGNRSTFKSFLDLGIWSLIKRLHKVPVKKSRDYFAFIQIDKNDRCSRQPKGPMT